MKKFVASIVMLLVLVVTGRAQGVSRLFGLVGGTPQSDNSSNGFLFSTDSSGQNFQLQYNFPVNVSGALPGNLELMPYNGKLYGTTSAGGVNDMGTIFEYDPATNIYTKKFDFGTNHVLYGGVPRGSLLLYNGKFYGLANSYGVNGAGTIFEYDPATNVVTKKYDLAGSQGAYPQNSMKLMNGKMYGTTTGGGTNGLGVVFQWDPATNIYTDLLDMTGTNGWSFYGNVTPYNNKIYCASVRGAANDAGAIYAIDPALPNGANTTIVHTFNGASGGNGNNSEMVVYNSKLYGTTMYGGTNGQGVLYEVDPAANTYNKVYDFNYSTVGAYPQGKLVANGGKFLGFCSNGGAAGTGTIFEWDPAVPGTAIKKYEFGANNYDNPINPGSTLAAFNGKFYAVTYYGGFNNQGSLFEYDYAAGTVVKKLNFNTAENGRTPYGRPALLNGKIYGTCYTGPQPDAGCIWEYDPSTAVYSRKFNFDLPGPAPNGYRPISAPIAYNGKLYGTLPSGGNSGYGVFYEYDPSTNIYVKSDFQPIGGSFPIGEPTVYNNKLYGMTNANGAGNNGIIYSYDPATGVLAKLYDVQSTGTNTPNAGFTVYNNKLYGVTSTGGANNYGAVISFDPATNTAVKLFDLAAATGITIQNVMTLYNNKLYGNALSGGTSGRGTMFSFDPSNNNYTVVYNYNTTTGGNGYDPTGILTLSGNKFYTITRDASTIVIAQLDPATNTVTTRSSYTPPNNLNLPVYHNAMTSVPAFIANGIPNSCENYPTVVISGANNNQWVPILNTAGDVVAEIKANGNNLGNVTVSTYINNGTVREDATHQMYLDRNISIVVQNQPSSSVDIRLYIKTSEYLALKNASNSQGQPSGITSINDVAVLKTPQTCSGSLSGNPSKLATVASPYEYGYVLAASVNSFSTFYFASKTFLVLPVKLVSFAAVKQESSVKLQWVTESETGTDKFEVEKSIDGRNFTPLGTVKANGGNLRANYTLTDNQPFAGINYYRLKSIDRNGNFSYSNIVAADFSTKAIVRILPNPAHDYIVITGLEGLQYIQLINAEGKIIKTYTANTANRYNISGVAKGMYWVRLTGVQHVTAGKIVIE